MLHRSQTSSLLKPKLDLNLIQNVNNQKLTKQPNHVLPAVAAAAAAEGQSLLDKRKQLSTAPAKLNQNNNNKSNKTENPSSNRKSSFVKDSQSKKHWKEKQMKEWAYKTITLEELGIEMPPKSARKASAENNNTPRRARVQNVSLNPEEILINEENAAKNFHLVNLDYLDEEENIYDMQNRNPHLNISKENTKKNQESRYLDSKLIELAKERFKTMDWIDYQKKEFVKKQIRKSKTLPGLK
jgi:hypothetical protein